LRSSELGNDDPAYRAAAAEGLGKIGSPSAVARLLPLVTEREAPVRNAAVKALGDIGDPAASPALVKALEDKTDYVRAAAIEALGKIGEPAMGLLFDAIAFGNPDYRLECMESLVAMGPKAVPSLAGALEGADAVLKPYIIRALGNIGSKDSIPALVRALDDAEGVVRGDAANALRMLAAGSALPKLRALARDDPNEYARAASEAAVRSISGQ
jgi:HEAT repeat protein